MTVDYDSPYDGGPGEVRMLSTELQTPSPIGFGYDIEPSFSQVLSDVTADAPVDKLFLLTDETLYELYGREFHQRLQEDWPDVKLHLLPPGEQAKSFTNLALLCEAMRKSGGVKKRAAQLLGISFRSFRYRFEKLGLDSTQPHNTIWRSCIKPPIRSNGDRSNTYSRR